MLVQCVKESSMWRVKFCIRKEKLAVGIVYKSLSSVFNEFLEIFSDKFLQFFEDEKNFMITKDFNTDFLSENSKKFKNEYLIMDQGLV